MKITVARGEKKEVVTVPDNATVEDLKKAYKPKVSPHRMSFRIPDAKADAAAAEKGKTGRPNYITLDGRKTLAEQGIKDGQEVLYKDLGPQIGYRTVFLVEYAGPLAFLAFYAMQPSFVYGATSRAFGEVQKMFIALFAAHFLKRELETVFVHKFSRPTMPLRNIFKNCTYYWSFAAFIGYVLCNPLYTAPSKEQALVGAGMMTVFELLNFAVHLQLSLMRKGDGDQARNVPKGPLFALVSCPNYFFEVMSWVSFSIGTNIIMSWVFTAAGLLQMTEWALKKHRGYIKADPKNRNKKSIIPFVI